MQIHYRYLVWMIPLILFSGRVHAISVEAWQAVVEPDGVQRVNISCGTNFFDPREIVVKKDVPLELIVRITGNLPQQNFVVRLPGQAFDRIVGRSSPAQRILPNIAGTFAMVCQTSNVFEDQKTQAKKSGVLHIVP